jgi:hypothetical protein
MHAGRVPSVAPVFAMPVEYRHFDIAAREPELPQTRRPPEAIGYRLLDTSTGKTPEPERPGVSCVFTGPQDGRSGLVSGDRLDLVY